MEKDLKFVDLLYFGYDFSDQALQNAKFQKDFMDEIKERFQKVELKDAYDQIKGFRQEVYLPDSDKDGYFSWLIGKGWFEMSLTMQLIMMSPNDKSTEFQKYIDLAKKEYPEAFKSTKNK